MRSLRTQLALSHIITSLVTVALISIMANIMIDKTFRTYVINTQEKKIARIIEQVTERYNKDKKTWSYDFLDNIGVSAMGNSLIIKVTSEDGSILWNAWEHNSGHCSTMLQNLAENMYSRYPNFNGAYVEDSYDIIVDEAKVGYVDIGYYGPFYYTDNDIAFISTFNSMLTGVGIISFVIAIILGFSVSIWLSRPISKIVYVTGQIAQGNLTERANIKSPTIEIRDMASAINNLAETLENIENMRKRLTGDIAHEFRTPLFTLQSQIEAMIDGIWQPNKERLKSCHDEIKRLSRMVEDLNKLAEFEAENLTLDKQSFDVEELLDSILINFEPEFAKKEIKFSFNKSFINKIYADKDKISQVIVNIISNSLKYTNRGGYVSISTEVRDNIAIIKIEDTGIGISDEDLPYIFERFYRTDKSRAKSTGGSGIGLTIAKSLVLVHNGELSVESALGEGTIFTILLPIKDIKVISTKKPYN